MNQAALNLNHYAPVDPVHQAIAAVQRDPLAFKSVTEKWLMDNLHVWETFYHKTEALRERGRKNYGAKCIYESMRFESAIADSEITFKLNNIHVSGLARLYNTVTGGDYFETREV